MREWRQMYFEAAARMREYFVDVKMGGVDWSAAVRKCVLAVSSRASLLL